VAQCGQVSPVAGAAGYAAVSGAVFGAGPSAPAAKAAAAPMGVPHTSQKSSLADWWPDGQVAIAIPS